MIIYGISAGAVSTVVYIRMYMMLTMLCTLDIYLHCLLFHCVDKITFLKKIAILCTVTVLGVLTHYYYTVVAFLSSFFYCIIIFVNNKEQNRKKLFIYATARVLSVLLAVLVFPAAIKQTTSGSRGVFQIANILGRLSNLEDFRTYCGYYLSTITEQIFGYWGDALLIGIIVIVCIKNNLFLRNSYVYLLGIVSTYMLFCINYTPSVGKAFRYMMNVYPAITILITIFIIKLIKEMIKEAYYNMVLIVVSILMILESGMTCIRIENIEYLHSSNGQAIIKVNDMEVNANLFINKGDSQEYAFWMQYINMTRQTGAYFTVTTYPRLQNMDDEYLNKYIFEKYSNGILIYIASYNQKDAEKIVNELIDRTELNEKEYIGLLDSERVYFCR